MNLSTAKHDSSPRRGGFTLTELLVATALTVIIMLMFAQMYSSAVGSIKQQRSLARNDNSARNLSTILRGDLQNLTFRQPSPSYGNVRGIVPLAPGDETIVDPLNQRGYFYFSENDPAIDWDDVLQFTVQVNTGERGDTFQKNQQRPFVGKAQSLGDNDPDDDNGTPGDQLGTSRAAEVSYFMRNGNLYRRVLLLRDPLSAVPPQPEQPSNAGAPVFTPTDNYSGLFYNDFDYAATRRLDGAGNSYLWFHSLGSLDNTRGDANFPLAKTSGRFGFSPFAGANLDKPVEYSAAAFFGRFTAEETSADNFTFPGDAADVFALPLNTYQDNTGDRVGEDILLPYVEGFDVEVWDPGTNSFADLNITSNNPGYTTGNLNANFGDNIFDTWHPTANAAVGNGLPPLKPVITPTSSLINWTANSSFSTTNNLTIRDRQTTAVLYGGGIIYSCVAVTGTGLTGAVQPEFPPVPGTIVQDGGITWQCVDNRVGLRGIRITIRYRDNGVGTPRQTSIVHSFVE